MPANIRETKIGFGYKKQTDLSTPNVSGDIWSLTKTNAALATVTLNTENDAAELGKGHEFATQVFKSHWDVSGSIEKFLTSEIAAWAFVFGLGNRTKSGTPPAITYTCTPQDPVSGGIELPAFSFIEAIRQGQVRCSTAWRWAASLTISPSPSARSRAGQAGRAERDRAPRRRHRAPAARR